MEVNTVEYSRGLAANRHEPEGRKHQGRGRLPLGKAVTCIESKVMFSMKGTTMDYLNLDLGTSKPTTVPYLEIEAVIDPEIMVDGYAQATMDEAERLNPLTFDRVGLQLEELIAYYRFLLYQRVLSVSGGCPLWRKLKTLYIPNFLQYVMTTVGIVDIRDRGIRIHPTMDAPTMDFDDAIRVSNKLSYFEGELAMVKDAMPRGVEGDRDTMSTALIAGYMRSLQAVEHPIATYAAAFLGLKLAEEQAMSLLYRVQYDDILYLRHVILQSREVRGRNE